MSGDILRAFEDRFDPARVPADAFYDDSDIILFAHIPKTAGMSVGKALQEAFDVVHSVGWENVHQSFRSKSRQALYARSNRKCRQVLIGHFGWGEIQVWRNQELPIKSATVIRDPLARFLSNYNYNCSPKHPDNESFNARFPTIEDYARDLQIDYQTHLLIGLFYDFDHALELLTKYYSFIGTTEHLGASLEHFRISHGLKGPLHEHHENAGTIPAPAAADVPPHVREMVEEKSRNDMRLHALVSGFYGGPSA